MTIEIIKGDVDAPFLRRLTVWFSRCAALALFALGLLYWTRLVGIVEGPLWRFDLMPLHWRVAAPALAVLYPIAGVGLWMAVSWGTVVWLAVALIEAAMLFAYPQVFGGDPTLFLCHAGGLSVLAALHVAGRFRRRRGDKV